MVATIIALLVIAVVVALSFRYRKMRRLEDQIVADYSGLLLPLWAIMGPYENGASSCRSMGLCLFAISSKADEKTVKYNKEQIIEMMKTHWIAFDSDPEEWNDAVNKAKSMAGENHYYLAKEINSIWKAKFEEEYDL
tara:strand:- start:622 stop:1032 length:411 start_codon:yes stop_codon:yes gene_type:complete